MDPTLAIFGAAIAYFWAQSNTNKSDVSRKSNITVNSTSTKTASSTKTDAEKRLLSEQNALAAIRARQGHATAQTAIKEGAGLLKSLLSKWV